jgi:hypothetical protein
MHYPAAPITRSACGSCRNKQYGHRYLVEEFGFTAHTKACGVEAQQIKRKAGYKTRRCVVERTHSWMSGFRGVLIRWSKKAENYIALLPRSILSVIAL